MTPTPSPAQPPHVTRNTGNVEWYTPAKYIEAAHAVMGGIDLDPASTALANTVVKAERFYTEKENGLALPWFGRVFLNPPYRRLLIEQFADRIVAGRYSGEFEQAIVLVNNATETSWFRAFVSCATAIVFPSKRISYWGVNGVGIHPLQGQAFIYYGPATFAFLREFGQFGWGTYL